MCMENQLVSGPDTKTTCMHRVVLKEMRYERLYDWKHCRNEKESFKVDIIDMVDQSWQTYSINKSSGIQYEWAMKLKSAIAKYTTSQNIYTAWAIQLSNELKSSEGVRWYLLPEHYQRSVSALCTWWFLSIALKYTSDVCDWHLYSLVTKQPILLSPHEQDSNYEFYIFCHIWSYRVQWSNKILEWTSQKVSGLIT